MCQRPGQRHARRARGVARPRAPRCGRSSRRRERRARLAARASPLQPRDARTARQRPDGRTSRRRTLPACAPLQFRPACPATRGTPDRRACCTRRPERHPSPRQSAAHTPASARLTAGCQLGVRPVRAPFRLAAEAERRYRRLGAQVRAWDYAGIEGHGYHPWSRLRRPRRWSPCQGLRSGGSLLCAMRRMRGAREARTARTFIVATMLAPAGARVERWGRPPASAYAQGTPPGPRQNPPVHEHVPLWQVV